MKVSLCLPILSLAAAPLLAQDLPAYVNTELPSLVDTYKEIHSHPELSHHEERTAALLADELQKAGYTVTEHVGKYPDGSQAYGVVAILKNGEGPALLIRTDLDALPLSKKPACPMPAGSKPRTPPGRMSASCMPAARRSRYYHDRRCTRISCREG